MSTPFLDRLRALGRLEDQLADAIRVVCPDAEIARGGATIAVIDSWSIGGVVGRAEIDLTHLAQELARNLP